MAREDYDNLSEGQINTRIEDIDKQISEYQKVISILLEKKHALVSLKEQSQEPRDLDDK